MRLRCGLCRDTFSWEPRSGWPMYCPKCGEYIGMDGKDDVVMPFISQAKNLGADRVYRDMEQKSEIRAQLASERTGLSAAEVSHLKVTNLRDNQRTGDVPAIDINNSVTQAMAAAPVGSVGMGSTMGVMLSAGTNRGALPRAGTNFIQGQLRQQHRLDAVEAVRASFQNNQASKK